MIDDYVVKWNGLLCHNVNGWLCSEVSDYVMEMKNHIEKDGQVY